MATTAFNGRSFVYKRGGSLIAGVQTRGFTTNNNSIDITTDDGGGEREELPDPGTRQVEYQVAGILGDEKLIADAFALIGSGDGYKNSRLDLPTILATAGNIKGKSIITNFQITGQTDGAVEFTATLQSSGNQTYTASA